MLIRTPLVFLSLRNSLVLSEYLSNHSTRPDTINTRPRRRPSVKLETYWPGDEARRRLASNPRRLGLGSRLGEDKLSCWPYYYASRRSRRRDTVKLTVCLCIPAVTAQRLQCDENASSHVLLDFDSWICKLKLCSRVMATLTHSEGCCSLFRILWRIICPHKLSIQP